MTISFRLLFSFAKKEIDYTFSNASCVNRRPGIKLLQAPAPADLSFGKLLVIIPGKSGNATVRNKFRRQAQSIFYEEHLYTKCALSILYVHQQGLELTFDELKKFLCRGFSGTHELKSVS